MHYLIKATVSNCGRKLLNLCLEQNYICDLFLKVYVLAENHKPLSDGPMLTCFLSFNLLTISWTNLNQYSILKYTAHLLAPTKHLEQEIYFTALKNCCCFGKINACKYFMQMLNMWDATSTVLVFAPQEGFVHCLVFINCSKSWLYE